MKNEYISFICLGSLLIVSTVRGELVEGPVRNLEYIDNKTLTPDRQGLKILESAIRTWDIAIRDVGGIEYLTTQNQPDSPVYSKVLWREGLQGYYFEFLVKNDIYKQKIEKIASFNGEHYMEFDPATQVLGIQAMPLPLNLPNSLDSPLIGYQFIKTRDSKSSKVLLSDLLIGSKDMIGFVDRCSILGREAFRGIDCVKVRVSNSYDYDLEEIVSYDVFLDPNKGFVPVRWSCYDSDGVLVKVYTIGEHGVLESENGASFALTKTATLWQCKWRGTISGPNGPERYFGMSKDISISSLERCKNLDFTLDPTIAASIYDVDSHTWLKVPK